MKTALLGWLKKKHPHWKWQLAGAGFGLAVIVAWYFTGTFFRGTGAVTTLIALWFVSRVVRWIVTRIRLTADAGIPFSLVRMVKDLLSERDKFLDADQRWALAMRANGVKYDGFSPNLKRKRLTADGSTRGHVNLAAIGGNLDKIRHLAADGTLAGIMHCQEVTVEPDGHGKAWLTFHKQAPSSRPLTLADLPVSGPDLVSFGREDVGGPAAVEYGLSVLVSGVTKSGKSKLGWNMFMDWLRDGRPMRLTLVDPKGTELAVFKPLVGKKVGNILIDGYIRETEPARMVEKVSEMFSRFVVEMKQRQDRMEAMGLRQITEPTEDFPARAVWTDELNELQKVYKTIDAPVVTAISQGRATLDWVVGMIQVAKVSVLGEVRDQFPIKVCMRTETKANASAALGLDPADTPPCHLIPRSTPGVGYYVTEDGAIRKFRTAHVTDSQLDDLAEGKLPKGTIMHAPLKYNGPPCFVYDAPLKGSNRRAYVGVAGADGTKHPVQTRRIQHRKYDLAWCVEHERVENFWNIHIDDRRMNVYKYPSRAAALIAEERLIRDPNSMVTDAKVKFTGRPIWNIQHNTDNPEANINLIKRAGMQTRARDALREYFELGREAWALSQVKAGYRKTERVERQVERRDRFVEAVTAGSAR